MSWRTLTIFLLLAGVASWQGGIQLGEWLVERAPESISSLATTKDSKEGMLDANGKPFTAQPPQPRVDGTLGVPKDRAPVEWTITPIIAIVSDVGSTNMPIDSEGQYERRDQAELAAGGAGLASGQNDIATLDVGATQSAPITPANSSYRSNNNVGVNTEPYRLTNPNNPNNDPSLAPVVTIVSWQQNLKRDLDQCNSVGFFQRPTCVQNARNKHCAPNNAWGVVADCPDRQF